MKKIKLKKILRQKIAELKQERRDIDIKIFALDNAINTFPDKGSNKLLI